MEANEMNKQAQCEWSDCPSHAESGGEFCAKHQEIDDDVTASIRQSLEDDDRIPFDGEVYAESMSESRRMRAAEED